MSLDRAESLYETRTKGWPSSDQLRLVEQIVHALSSVRGSDYGARDAPDERVDWMSVRGIAPGIMEGEDAQEWVSRTRRESDDQRTMGCETAR